VSNIERTIALPLKMHYRVNKWGKMKGIFLFDTLVNSFVVSGLSITANLLWSLHNLLVSLADSQIHEQTDRGKCVFLFVVEVFWLIPPSEENLSLYVSWTLSSRQNDVFFGDMVKDCYRITLEAGWTFFIPTGIVRLTYGFVCVDMLWSVMFLYVMTVSQLM